MDVPTPTSAPPLAVDIDGTLTDDRRVLDPRAAAVLQTWPAPVAIATGKAFPYPVALCEFLGLEPTVIAENGGVVLVGREGPVRFGGDPEAAAAVAADLAEQGYGPGWGDVDLVNRWRETELAVSRELPRDVVEGAAETEGLVVLDTGFAYHVVSPTVSKGTGLETLAKELNREPRSFVAVGDSENDAALFEIVGQAVAVGSADDRAKAVADHVTDAGYADGFLEAVRWLTGEGTA